MRSFLCFWGFIFLCVQPVLPNIRISLSELSLQIAKFLVVFPVAIIVFLTGLILRMIGFQRALLSLAGALAPHFGSLLTLRAWTDAIIHVGICNPLVSLSSCTICSYLYTTVSPHPIYSYLQTCFASFCYLFQVFEVVLSFAIRCLVGTKIHKRLIYCRWWRLCVWPAVWWL